MVDIPSLSAAIAAASVVIGVIFAVLQLRNLVHKEARALTAITIPILQCGVFTHYLLESSVTDGVDTDMDRKISWQEIFSYAESRTTITVRLCEHEQYPQKYYGHPEEPVITRAKMRYFADLNGDGKVNIVDIYIVARAFGSKLGDSNWNPDADLDNNGEIDIMDLYKVAREFGKKL